MKVSFNIFYCLIVHITYYICTIVYVFMCYAISNDVLSGYYDITTFWHNKMHKTYLGLLLYFTTLPNNM